MTISFWIIAAITVILLLASYAIFLLWKLWQQKKLRQSNAPDNRVNSINPKPHLSLQRRKSIYALSCAIEEDALTLTEGCIRISAIASQLGDMESFNRKFGVITRVAEETSHIPILDAWQRLPKQDQRKFDREREQTEQKYREAVLATLADLKAAFRD